MTLVTICDSHRRVYTQVLEQGPFKINRRLNKGADVTVEL